MTDDRNQTRWSTTAAGAPNTCQFVIPNFWQKAALPPLLEAREIVMTTPWRKPSMVYKAEVIHHKGPWKDLKSVEMATLTWVSWFNEKRLLSSIGHVPPVEAEENFYKGQAEEADEV
jgi:transposase InsO family protein